MLHSFLWPSNIPCCGYTTFCLSIHVLTDIWIVSKPPFGPSPAQTSPMVPHCPQDKIHAWALGEPEIKVGAPVVSRRGSQGTELRNSRPHLHHAHSPGPAGPEQTLLPPGEAGTEVTAQFLFPGNLQREVFRSGKMSGRVVEGH